MYVCNVQESDLKGENEYVHSVRAVAEREGANVVVVSAAIEAEVVELPLEDRAAVLSDLGMKESGLNNVWYVQDTICCSCSHSSRLDQRKHVRGRCRNGRGHLPPA